MSWRERDEGARAFRSGQSRWGSNPHDDGYSADHDERMNHRDWEDGHREAEHMQERREEREQDERREQHLQDEMRQIRAEEEEQDYWARLQEQEECERESEPCQEEPAAPGKEQAK